jgi:hypothetical protein
MRPQLFTSWVVACHSPQESQSLQRWLSSHIDLDRVFTDTIQAAPAGVEEIRSVSHRLGDYFASIRILPASPASFRLVFQRLPEAKRFWKDLMVNILQEIEAAPETESIQLGYKGDKEPSAVSEAS